MKRVLFLQSQVKKFRKPFLEASFETLKNNNIQFHVYYSEPSKKEKAKNDTVDLPPDVGTKIPAYHLAKGRVLFQHVFPSCLEYDLIIMEQENKHLVNPLFIAMSRLGLKRVAFWGHGYNHQGLRDSVSERIKQKLVPLVDWWFAYTDGVADYVSSAGMKRERISVFNNSVDTKQLQCDLQSVSTQDCLRVSEHLGVPENAKIGIFCGSLYSGKKIDFLLESSKKLKVALPEFHLIVVGDGPDRPLIEAAIEGLPWIHYVGPKFGREKAIYLKMSDIFLHPGAVGLAVLDAFAAGLPFMTTTLSMHGPEIDYLISGKNGIVSEFDSLEFSNSIYDVLSRPSYLAEMKTEALASAQLYSIEQMVSRFTDGVIECLKR